MNARRATEESGTPVHRVSVRALVEHSLGVSDISPTGGLEDMLAGGLAHRARQAKKREGWQSEAPVSLERTDQGITLLITGRIDLYKADDELSWVEEIKLCGEAPEQPYPAHRAQAVCYAHMKAIETGCPEFMVRVAYADISGSPKALFDERMGAEALADEFERLFIPYAQWRAGLLGWKVRRDESIRAMPFPYPTYRPGQHTMAIQAYTAIRLKKRLFASMPTGTGKSAATLFPAIKALAEGMTGTVFCLTARGTAQESAVAALDAMRAHGLVIRAVQIGAKEKLCPMSVMRCAPEHCERARGHYVRQRAAMRETMNEGDWRVERILSCADRYTMCPFEYSLALSEIADVVICDYNYAFDPMVRIRRIFERRHDLTLLVDEAHHLPERARASLSGVLSGEAFSALRREYARVSGRKTPVYKALTALIAALRALPDQEGDEAPEAFVKLAEALPDVITAAGTHVPGGFDRLRDALMFSMAMQRNKEHPEEFKLLVEREGKQGAVEMLCLDAARHLQGVTNELSGCVYFSATLEPLSEMRAMMGGDDEDALLELPSPFDPNRFLVMRLPLDTRYRERERTAQAVGAAIRALYDAKRGKYIAFFPSYAYLELVKPFLEDCAPLVQSRHLDDASKASFLAAFTEDDEPLMGLCVLGGMFAEGVDLPGRRLIGVCVVGVGLPMVGKRQEALRERYEDEPGGGFARAYRYPGMHKVLQAAGRVIRTPEDKGAALLIDTRYLSYEYETLLPKHWQVETVRSAEDTAARAAQFWRSE